jgi:hypothetical protein
MAKGRELRPDSRGHAGFEKAAEREIRSLKKVERAARWRGPYEGRAT